MTIKLLSRLHHNDNTGETLVEFFSAQTFASHSGINHINIVCGPMFNNHEMVKFPVDDGGKADKAQFIHLTTHRYRPYTHTIAACHFDNIQSRETIAAYSIAITD